MQNRSTLNPRNPTSIHNVRLINGRYVVKIAVDNVEHSFGRFDTLKEAVEAAGRARAPLHPFFVAEPEPELADQELLMAA